METSNNIQAVFQKYIYFFGQRRNAIYGGGFGQASGVDITEFLPHYFMTAQRQRDPINKIERYINILNKIRPNSLALDSV
jgi:hypothetical protein